MSSIRIHPKFGVNAMVSQCFWCGEGKNELALLGAAYKEEAPHQMVLNYEPCGKCAAGMAQGVTLIEASKHPTQRGQAEIQQGVYPTGRWWVITHDAAGRIFDIPLKDKAFLEVGLAERIGLVAPADAA